MEVTYLSRNIGDLGIGNNGDVLMTSGVDEFWGKDAHRTVVGRECLVKLCHRPSYG